MHLYTAYFAGRLFIVFIIPVLIFLLLVEARKFTDHDSILGGNPEDIAKGRVGKYENQRKESRRSYYSADSTHASYYCGESGVGNIKLTYLSSRSSENDNKESLP